ncbi:hypothetical protein ACEQ6A_35745, partial [Rhizobium brockwellii]
GLGTAGEFDFGEVRQDGDICLYGNLWKQDELPPLQLRTMTQNAPDRAGVPDDVPSGAMATTGFYGRLLTAWIAMGFKAPD